MDTNLYIDQKKIPKEYGISLRILRLARKKNQLTTYKEGRTIYLSIAQIEEFIKRTKNSTRVLEIMEKENITYKKAVKNYLESLKKIRTGVTKDIKLLGILQAGFGGSVTNVNWCNTDKENKLNWSKLHEEYINKNTFIDTLILAYPVKLRVSEGKLLTEERNNQVEHIRAIFNTGGKKIDKNLPYHGQIIFNIPSATPIEYMPKELEKILKTKINYKKLWNRQSKLPSFAMEGETYYGYQLYRVTCCNQEINNVISKIKTIRKGSYIKYNFPFLVVRFDVTTNFPGAVPPSEKKLSGLVLKDNKHFVGKTCHSYTLGEDKYISKILSEKRKGKDCFYSSMEKTISHKLTCLCNLEASPASDIMEVKIYDKLRYMLELSSIHKTLTGFNLGKLAYTNHTNITYLLENFSKLGVSRVETRIRGEAIFYTPGDWREVHKDLSEVLVNTYSYRASFQESIDSFFKSIKACVGLVIKDSKGQERYLVSQWINVLTGKIQGQGGSSKEHEALNSQTFTRWIESMSNREVPLVIATFKDTLYKENTMLDKEDFLDGRNNVLPYQIIGYEVLSPMVKGFSNVLLLGTNQSTAYAIGKGFKGFHLHSFRVSASNSQYLRGKKECFYTTCRKEAEQQVTYKKALFNNMLQNMSSNLIIKETKFKLEKNNPEEYLNKKTLVKDSIGVYAGYIVYIGGTPYFMALNKSSKGYIFFKLVKQLKYSEACETKLSHYCISQNPNRRTKSFIRKVHLV